MRNIFKFFDADNSGFINKEESVNALNQIGFKLDSGKLEEYFKENDKIDFESFKNLVCSE